MQNTQGVPKTQYFSMIQSPFPTMGLIYLFVVDVVIFVISFPAGLVFLVVNLSFLLLLPPAQGVRPEEVTVQEVDHESSKQ